MPHSHSFFSRTESAAAHFAAFALAILIYAAFSSPTPDNPGAVEAVIAVLLIAGLGFPALYGLFSPEMSGPAWRPAGRLLLWYGFLVSLPAAVVMGNDVTMVLRDAAPFLFLFMPLLAVPLFLKRPDFFPYLVIVFLLSGFLFSLRGILESDPFRGYFGTASKELHYFANAPSVLFAAIFPAGWALRRYLRSLRFRDLMMLAACGLFTLVPLLAMALSAQRASLGYAVLAYGVFAVIGLVRALYRFVPLLVLVALIGAPLLGYALEIFEALSHKTAVHGINKRGLEMEAVWDAVSRTRMTTVFGLGWGGTFEDPAVGGARVNYTHNLMTGMLLKGGMAGLLIALGYLAALLIPLREVLRRDCVLGLALAGPFVIDVVLYASYKWLDFGLLLLVMTAAVATAPCLLYGGEQQKSGLCGDF